MLNDYLIQRNFWAAIKTHHFSFPYTSLPHQPLQQHITTNANFLYYRILINGKTHQNAL